MSLLASETQGKVGSRYTIRPRMRNIQRKCSGAPNTGTSIYKYGMILCMITYLPHKAVAEVSKDKEPIGRECAEFNWFESQLMSDSNELRVK